RPAHGRHAPGRGAHPPHRHRRRPGRLTCRGRRPHPAQARMSLASPVLLIVGLIVAAALGWAAAVLSQRRAASLAAAGVTAARRAGGWLSIAGIAVLAVAAAGPAASVPVPRAAGTVILAMDVSGSMGARDVAPTRLAAAQRAARSFIEAQPDSVDIGVVAFEE